MFDSRGECDFEVEELPTSGRPESDENSGDLRKEIVCAICRKLMLVNQMQGSLNDFEEVLIFAMTCFVIVMKVSQRIGQGTGDKL